MSTHSGYSFTFPHPHIILRIFYPNVSGNPTSDSLGFLYCESSQCLTFRKSQSISLIPFSTQGPPHGIFAIMHWMGPGM